MMRAAVFSLLLGSFLSACGDGTQSSDGAGGSSSNATSGGPAGSTGAGANATAAQSCVDAINGYRATLGLPAYKRWTDAEPCADGQALSDGTSMQAHGAFGKCMESAQDECPGWPGPPETMITGCLKQMWAEGPGTDFSTHGHYINMSSTKYTMVSCGFHTFPDGSVWAAQDFK